MNLPIFTHAKPSTKQKRIKGPGASLLGCSLVQGTDVRFRAHALAPRPRAFYAFLCLTLGSLLMASPAQAEWEVDFSRRRTPARPQAVELPKVEERAEISQAATETLQPLLAPVAGVSEMMMAPEQEIVILNTDKGFVPQTVRVRQGGRYLIHVVNINENERNVSFMLDAFSENHATFFGKVKTFQITPQQDGIFSFQCPETSSQGKLVVAPSGGAKPRLPAAAPALPMWPTESRVIQPDPPAEKARPVKAVKKAKPKKLETLGEAEEVASEMGPIIDREAVTSTLLPAEAKSASERKPQATEVARTTRVLPVRKGRAEQTSKTVPVVDEADEE